MVSELGHRFGVPKLSLIVKNLTSITQHFWKSGSFKESHVAHPKPVAIADNAGLNLSAAVASSSTFSTLKGIGNSEFMT